MQAREQLSDVLSDGSPVEGLYWNAEPLSAEIDPERILVNTSQLHHAARWTGAHNFIVAAEFVEPESEIEAPQPGDSCSDPSQAVGPAALYSFEFSDLAPNRHYLPIGRGDLSLTINNHGILDRDYNPDTASWVHLVNQALREGLRQAAVEQYIRRACQSSRLLTGMNSVLVPYWLYEHLVAQDESAAEAMIEIIAAMTVKFPYNYLNTILWIVEAVVARELVTPRDKSLRDQLHLSIFPWMCRVDRVGMCALRTFKPPLTVIEAGRSA